MNITSILVATLILASLAAQEVAAVDLVVQGKPTSTIVIADNPTDAAEMGAADLQMWLQKSSGAMVPIKHEGEVLQDTDEEIILVGPTWVSQDSSHVGHNQWRSTIWTSSLCLTILRSPRIPVQLVRG